jgi:hypothetical protein
MGKRLRKGESSKGPNKVSEKNYTSIFSSPFASISVYLSFTEDSQKIAIFILTTAKITNLTPNICPISIRGHVSQTE